MGVGKTGRQILHQKVFKSGGPANKPADWKWERDLINSVPVCPLVRACREDGLVISLRENMPEPRWG